MKRILPLLLCLLLGGTQAFSQTFYFHTNRAMTEINPNSVATRFFNISDSTNTAVGLGSNFETTTGRLNTAFGGSALSKNNTGLANTAVGFEAMKEARALGNSTLVGNTAIGSGAMQESVNSNYNTAVGFEALNENIVSDNNTAVGYYAMHENTYGHSNTAIGPRALYGNKVDSFNVAIGAYALENTLNLNPGSQNVAIGYEAMRSGGDNAVVIGAESGKLRKQLGVVIGNFSHQNSSDNTVIGDSSMHLGVNMVDNVAIGKNVMKLSSNQGGTTDLRPYYNVGIGENTLYRNNALGNVAIGKDAMSGGSLPYRNVAIGTSALKNHNAYQGENVAIGKEAMIDATSGRDNVVIGFESGKSLVSGSQNTIIGASTTITGNPTNLTVIASNGTFSGSNKVIIGNSSVSTISGYAPYTNYSDRRLKKNIVYSKALGLDFINGLKTAKYTYIADKTQTERDGLIAQDVQALSKQMGVHFSGLHQDDDEQQTLSISYATLVIPLINAHQELAEKLDKSEIRYASAIEKNKRLREQLTALLASKNK